jgi:hypothetical protein
MIKRFEFSNVVELRPSNDATSLIVDWVSLRDLPDRIVIALREAIDRPPTSVLDLIGAGAGYGPVGYLFDVGAGRVIACGRGVRPCGRIGEVLRQILAGGEKIDFPRPITYRDRRSGEVIGRCLILPVEHPEHQLVSVTPF